jgi:hypothetical protein
MVQHDDGQRNVMSVSFLVTVLPTAAAVYVWVALGGTVPLRPDVVGRRPWKHRVLTWVGLFSCSVETRS